MTENLTIDKTQTDEEIYLALLPQLEALINSEEPIISNLSNLSAALKEAFDKISWVGFYLLKNNKLFLGPFQGKTACTLIKIGEGVCGTSAQKRETIIVEDVDKFPGHIACDAGSKSEIVVPLIKNEKLIGVLDVDSYALSSFSKVDKKYLEKICELLNEKLDLEKFILT
jgi:GAF domain-containing protein